jgi:hypothetical protein
VRPLLRPPGCKLVGQRDGGRGASRARGERPLANQLAWTEAFERSSTSFGNVSRRVLAGPATAAGRFGIGSWTRLDCESQVGATCFGRRLFRCREMLLQRPPTSCTPPHGLPREGIPALKSAFQDVCKPAFRTSILKSRPASRRVGVGTIPGSPTPIWRSRAVGSSYGREMCRQTEPLVSVYEVVR